MNLAIAIIAVLAALASAVAAIGSLRSSRRANETTRTLANLESDRRHSELTPSFEIELTPFGNANDEAWLDLRQTNGPLVLDSVVITILDEVGQDHWSRGLPENLSAEDAAVFIWGPYEFNSGASEQVDNYRKTKPRRYHRIAGTDWDHLHLVRTRPGAWMAGTLLEDWRAEHSGPLRLLITCELEDYAPWHIPVELPVK
jgi:hypothetical protein